MRLSDDDIQSRHQHTASPQVATNAANGRALDETIAALAELYPATFLAEAHVCAGLLAELDVRLRPDQP
jgi:hypothetical protein